jgi:Undecaprenyl-phosphate glucose phosphotransferase
MSILSADQTQLQEPADEYHNRLFAVEEVNSGTGWLRHMARWQIVIVAKIIEVITITLVALLICALNVRLGPHSMEHYVAASVTIAAACYIIFLNSDLYDIMILIDSAAMIKPIAINWTVVFVTLAGTLALVNRPDLFSRLWFTELYGAGLVAVGFGRWNIERLVRAWVAQGHYTKAVAIVGANELAVKLIEKFKKNTSGIRIIGVFDDRDSAVRGRSAPVGRLGNISDLLVYGRTHMVDLVVLTLPLVATDRISSVIKRLREQPLDIRILPGPAALEMLSPIRLPRRELPGVQLITVMDRPLSEIALFIKSAFDRVTAFILCLLLLPLLAICAAGILLSDGGPILFSQMRIGYKGKPFKIYKFRTMRLNHDGVTGLTRRNDPRVFRFGELLRKTSIDELPQLLNVLKGDMSLIGPRPHLSTARAAGKLYFEAVNEYAARHRVKPGITGWAQVNGWRGPTETIEQIEQRVEHDIYYIENWSLYIDLVILIRTGLSGLWGKNAF